MAAITFSHKGDFKATTKFLKTVVHPAYTHILEKYGQAGVDALKAATPVRTGKTAESWSYDISETNAGATITWYNSNVNNGVNIAVILQYGHGTNRGAYVKGIDYIKPAMKPVFDELADKIWKEVTNA